MEKARAEAERSRLEQRTMEYRLETEEARLQSAQLRRRIDEVRELQELESKPLEEDDITCDEPGGACTSSDATIDSPSPRQRGQGQFQDSQGEVAAGPSVVVPVRMASAASCPSPPGPALEPAGKVRVGAPCTAAMASMAIPAVPVASVNGAWRAQSVPRVVTAERPSPRQYIVHSRATVPTVGRAPPAPPAGAASR
mmetsp:Transcript_53702/g.115444  ORF Transcript_53702/g.115444 Transcript_53702/m.115444 type:complete len:197 (+) Transcript_53702:2-592(+)